jgi:hypothetical protein
MLSMLVLSLLRLPEVEPGTESEPAGAAGLPGPQ